MGLVRCETGNPKVPIERKDAATILVVDDDPSMLRAIERLLSSSGFHVLAFESAEALLAIDLPNSQLCLVTDIYLPGASGIELTESINRKERTVPAILMTARTDFRTRKLADSAGPVATLYKPFDEEVLLEAIDRALDCC